MISVLRPRFAGPYFDAERHIRLVALLIVAACSTPSATTLVTTATPASTTALPTTAAPTTTAVRTTSPPPVTTTTSAPQPQPQLDPISYVGSSSDVIEFEQAALDIIARGAVFTYQVGGEGNNFIFGLDEGFEQSQLLVNTIGSESGQRFLNIFEAGPAALEIDVGGNWEVTISPVARISPASTLDDFYVPMVDTTGTYDQASTRSITVEGPAAILLKTNERTADIVATGDGNLIVYAASAADQDVVLVVNDIDGFDGTVLLPDCSLTCYLDISDGNYTITIP